MIDLLQSFTTLATTNLAQSVSEVSVAVMGAGSILLATLAVKAVLTRTSWPQLKKPIFILMAVVVILTTATLESAALLLNAQSATGGAVHWQAGYQVWACGNQLDLRDPRGLMNDRIGTTMLFERNDSKIHIEGTPLKLPDDASLGEFMQAVGGEISDSSLTMPLNESRPFASTPNTPEQVQSHLATNRDGSYVRFVNGQQCDGMPAEVQAFAYHYDGTTKTAYQTKLDHPANYEIAHASSVPPGDCIIMEFAPKKDKTDHTCTPPTPPDYCAIEAMNPYQGISAECAKERGVF